MSNSNNNNSIVALVELPSDLHKLYCWKVRNGSSVRTGETLALTKLKDDHASADATASATKPAPQHKRPTRRKRPSPAAAATTENTTEDSTSEKPAAATKAPAKKDHGDDSETTTLLSPAEKPAAAEQSTSDAKPKSKTTLVPVVANGDGIVRMYRPAGSLANPLVIGYIEPCQHPAVVAGLCAVCGKAAQMVPTKDNTGGTRNTQEDENNKMSRITYGGVTVAISDQEGQQMSQHDAERLRKQRKLSLVLDLDHTLVHATNDVRAREYLQQRRDVRSLVLPVIMATTDQQRGPPATMWMQHFVKLRPHVKEFLETALSRYEVGVYTAGTREYADQITIMLARHLVGSRCDQIELDGLRRQVSSAVAELDRARSTRDAVVVKNGLKGGEEVEKKNSEEPEGSEEDENSSKKRKRVTFGEVPSSEKTDHLTPEKVADLRLELEEAERLEVEAHEMRKRLFGSRVVSRTEVGDLGRDVKSLKRIFPCGGTMAVVVDDREDVWANASDVKSTRKGEPPENLLLVRPYHWNPFLGFADVNNAAGVDISAASSKSEKKNAINEPETDEQLLWTCDILKRLHERFYADGEDSEHTVMGILHQMRREVLAGGKVVLSGLVPLHKQNVKSNAPRPNVVRYVESLGATLLPSVTDTTTHVVAAKDGTDKTLAARRVRGCFVVKASWLMECFWTITRRDERKHLLGPAPRASQVQPMGSSKLENASSSSDNDEDDELAAAFESELMEE